MAPKQPLAMLTAIMIRSNRTGSVACTIDVVSNIAEAIYAGLKFLDVANLLTRVVAPPRKSLCRAGTLFA